MEFQDLRERFLALSFGKPHQNFLKARSKDELIEVGSKNELMA
jgi:hypothetical protein